MEKQKAEARKSWTGNDAATSEAQWFAVQDEGGRTEFLGYETEEAEGAIVAMLKDGARVTSAKAGETVQILTNQTPFYGESGGQAGDTGPMLSAKAEGKVIDTAEETWRFACACRRCGAWHPVGRRRRRSECRSRTPESHPRQPFRHAPAACRAQACAGHRMSARKVRWSMPDRLRFDFSHPKPVTPEDLARD